MSIHTWPTLHGEERSIPILCRPALLKAVTFGVTGAHAWIQIGWSREARSST
jgi:hypothetical protein